MLVQSRSKACGTCQTRKVKCDRCQPVCNQCIQGGWDCPGYAKAWKRREKTATIHPYEQQWLPDSEIQKKTTPRHARIVINPTPNTKTSPLNSHSFNSNSGSVAELSKEVIAHLEDKKPPGIHIRNLGQFFDFVPSRLGQSKALDDAVRCTLTAYSACLQENAGSLNHDRREYYEAVRSLRIAFGDEKEALSDETLCAAVLLSWYEVLADNLDESWLTHICGTSHIIKLRGPARHRSGFGLALLESQEGLISGEAMTTFTPCFLDAPEWHGILNHENMIVGLPQTRPLTISNKILAQLSTLLIEANHASELDEPKLRDALEQLWELRKQIKGALDHVLDMAENRESDFAPLLCCKDSIYLILIDTTILKILAAPAFSHPTLSKTIQGLQNLSLPSKAFSDRRLFNEAIESQIRLNFIVFLSNLAVASRVTPFNMRKMAFMCRIMCVERKKREAKPHSIWARFEQAISGVNEANWLSTVVASHLRDREEILIWGN
ncbi:uncharacterized protein PAC_19386 [Phialocephala subalpina]|uniref:Zn(2)-C6 fungal-type domain-containing protein n=1 Tax=Phialocephala subalpina TaxID=576137 RepID=A0A1L7XWS8_9HELO|nr:uncharacterized protein PAC_19386 [Phialocephala subalpina]